MRRHAALQIGKLEVGRAVSAIGGAEQGEQRRILLDAERLAVAEGPAFGREVEAECAQFAEKLVAHRVIPPKERPKPTLVAWNEMIRLKSIIGTLQSLRQDDKLFVK